MPAAFAKIAIGLARNSRLNLGDGFDRNVRFFYKIVEAPAGDRVSASVDQKHRLNEIGSGYAPDLIYLDRNGVVLCFGFGAKDSDQRRRVDDHRGSPRAS